MPIRIEQSDDAIVKVKARNLSRFVSTHCDKHNLRCYR
jgi:hypothetical protein